MARTSFNHPKAVCILDIENKWTKTISVRDIKAYHYRTEDNELTNEDKSSVDNQDEYYTSKYYDIPTTSPISSTIPQSILRPDTSSRTTESRHNQDHSLSTNPLPDSNNRSRIPTDVESTIQQDVIPRLSNRITFDLADRNATNQPIASSPRRVTFNEEIQVVN